MERLAREEALLLIGRVIVRHSILNVLFFSSTDASTLQMDEPVIRFSNSSYSFDQEVVFKTGEDLNVTCYSPVPVEWIVVQVDELLVNVIIGHCYL